MHLAEAAGIIFQNGLCVRARAYGTQPSMTMAVTTAGTRSRRCTRSSSSAPSSSKCALRRPEDPHLWTCAQTRSPLRAYISG